MITSSKSTILLLAFSLLFFISCNSELGSNEKKDFSLSDLKDDDIFQNYMAASNQIADFGTTEGVEIYPKKEISTNKSENFSKDDLAKVTNSPDLLMERIKEAYSFREKLFKKYPQLNNFSEEKVKDFLTSFVKSSLNKKHNSNIKHNDYDVTYGPHDHTPPEGCEDGDGYREDVSRCHTDQYIEAAACGLLSPTLILAATCGGVVIAKSAVCHQRAEEDNC